MPLILPGNVGSATAGGFDVANSLRFNFASSDFLDRTPDSASNRRTFTFSCWVKRSVLDIRNLFSATGTDAARPDEIRFSADHRLYVSFRNTEDGIVATARLFRDVSAWYHIVVAVDTTQATAGNRVKIYVNGVQETTLTGDGAGDSATFPNEDFESLGFNQASNHQIGSRVLSTPTLYFDGYMSEVIFIDGSALAADQFGEFDSDSGIWKPINVSGLTFGTNGFYLQFKEAGTSQNSSGMGADTSGNDNHFAVNNLTAVDQSIDTCTNNMPTFNSNDNQRQGFTFTEGNLKITATPAYDYVVATMGVSSGKWYWETKIITIPNLNYIYNGISDHNQYQADFDMGGEAGQYCLSRVAGKIKAAQGAETTYGGSMSANDIQGFALDVDNLKLYISNNGQWSNGSGAWDSTTFNAGTGVINIAYSTLPGGGTHWFPAIGNGANNIGMEINFGSPVSAISSGNTDGNGYGNFEYAVPSGYYALNTKNLAEYG